MNQNAELIKRNRRYTDHDVGDDHIFNSNNNVTLYK